MVAVPMIMLYSRNAKLRLITVFSVGMSNPAMPTNDAVKDKTTTATATPLDAFKDMKIISFCEYSLFLKVIWNVMNLINRKAANKTADFVRNGPLNGSLMINPTRINTKISKMFDMTPEKSKSFSFSFR